MSTPRHLVADYIAERTLAAQPQPTALNRSIAAYLLETSRTGELESLIRDVIVARAERGVVEVIAVSTHQLADSLRADIRRIVRTQYPAAKEIIISERIDPTVIAGVRLEFPHNQLDLTVRNTLNRFKQLTSAGE